MAIRYLIFNDISYQLIKLMLKTGAIYSRRSSVAYNKSKCSDTGQLSSVDNFLKSTSEEVDTMLYSIH